MGCGIKCIKVLLIVLNILFWVIGLGLLALGVWIKVDERVANAGEAINIGLSENVIEIVSWIFIGAGVFAFIVGFFGCCGAIRESRILLGFYIFCLIVIFGVEFAIAVWVGIRFDSVEDSIKVDGSTWIKEKYDGDSVISQGWNYVQVKFCCCGVNSYLDYKDSKYVENSPTVNSAYMSKACCKENEKDSTTTVKTNIKLLDEEGCVLEALNLSANETQPPTYNSLEDQCAANFRPTGCYDSLSSWAKDHMIAFIAVGAGVAFIQVIIFILAVIMCVRIERDDK